MATKDELQEAKDEYRRAKHLYVTNGGEKDRERFKAASEHYREVLYQYLEEHPETQPYELSAL